MVNIQFSRLLFDSNDFINQFVNLKHYYIICIMPCQIVLAQNYLSAQWATLGLVLKIAITAAATAAANQNAAI